MGGCLWVVVALALLSRAVGDGDNDCYVINLAGSIAYYKNTGNRNDPEFTVYTSGTTGLTTPWHGINVGAGASIECVDLDGDYDFDCLVGTTSGTIIYYKNTGSATNAAFTLADSGGNAFSSFSGTGATAIRCVDLDADGDLDCILGLASGFLSYYENTGSATSAAFTLKISTDDPFDGFATAGTNAALAFADFDDDQDLDLVVGDSGGLLQYYKNTGSRTAPVFVLQTGADDIFGAVVLNDGYATPMCLDFDRDADIDCFFGADTGYIKYVMNEGTAAAATMSVQAAEKNFDGTDTSVVLIATHEIDVGAVYYTKLVSGDRLDYKCGTANCITGLSNRGQYFAYKIAGGTTIHLMNKYTIAVPPTAYANAAAEQAACVQFDIGGIQTDFGTDMNLQLTTYNPFDAVDVGSNSALACMDVDADCAMHAACSNHGICHGTRQCACYEGWGSDEDISNFKSAACTARTCPSGRAWIDLPTDATTAHALAECSNQGICDRSSGQCKCFHGFTGESCQRMKCPSTSNDQDCSGHGRCVSMKRMATLTEAMPLSAATTYTGNVDTTTWDEEKIYGCVCDSSWTVGLASGETQQAEYFGPACASKRCPTGNDPVIHEAGTILTDCGGIVAEGGFGTGATGNICHVDCSNRGICDYTSGTCSCFIGFWGENCGNIDGLALGSG